jgi:hypothetical protein
MQVYNMTTSCFIICATDKSLHEYICRSAQYRHNPVQKHSCLISTYYYWYKDESERLGLGTELKPPNPVMVTMCKAFSKGHEY